MKDNGTYLERAIRLFESMDSSPSIRSEEKVHLLVDLAQVEATHALARSQRLLVKTQLEANRLRRIELGIAEPGDIRKPGITDTGIVKGPFASTSMQDTAPARDLG